MRAMPSVDTVAVTVWAERSVKTRQGSITSP